MAAVRKSTAEQSRSVVIVESSRAYAAMLAAHCRQMRMVPVVCEGIGQSLGQIPTLPRIAGITVDAALNDGDGLDLIDSLRALPHLASTPILFITADDDAALARAALIAGATAVCRKTMRHCVENALSVIGAELNAPLRSGRVLVVENDPALGRLIASVCSKLGIGVDLAKSVSQGLALFHKHTYLAVVSDVILAGRETGIDLVRRIRQIPDDHARVPILVTANHNDTARRLAVLRSGADDYLAKPLLAEELFWRLHNLLRRAEAGTPLASTEIASANDDVPPTTSAHNALSERETEIAQAITQGLSDKAIALKFGISFWTVRSHINRIFSKLGLFNRVGLVKYMIQQHPPEAVRGGAMPLHTRQPGK